MKFTHALLWVIAAALLWAGVAASYATSYSDVLTSRIISHWFQGDRA